MDQGLKRGILADIPDPGAVSGEFAASRAVKLPPKLFTLCAIKFVATTQLLGISWVNALYRLAKCR